MSMSAQECLGQAVVAVSPKLTSGWLHSVPRAPGPRRRPPPKGKVPDWRPNVGSSSPMSQKAPRGPTRDKSIGEGTTGVSDVLGDWRTSNGDGGIGHDISSRIRSTGSGINGGDNRDKSVACSIRDCHPNDPVAPGGRETGSGRNGEVGKFPEPDGVTGDVTGKYSAVCGDTWNTGNASTLLYV